MYKRWPRGKGTGNCSLKALGKMVKLLKEVNMTCKNLGIKLEQEKNKNKELSERVDRLQRTIKKIDINSNTAFYLTVKGQTIDFREWREQIVK
jgi:hypothetical protein